MDPHSNFDDKADSRGGGDPFEGNSARMPVHALALSSPQERESAVHSIRLLQSKSEAVDEGLGKLVEIETLQRYRAEQETLQEQLRDEIQALRDERQDIRDSLNSSDKRIRSELTVIAEDLCDSFDIARSLYKKLDLRDVPAKESLPRGFRRWNPPVMKEHIAELLTDLKTLTTELWGEVLWRVEGTSEPEPWCPFISRQSARASGLEKVLGQLESLSCRVDTYFAVGNSPLPEELRASEQHDRLRAHDSDMVDLRRRLKQAKQEQSKTCENLKVLKSYSSRISQQVGATLEGMCRDVRMLLEQCQARPSLISKEAKLNDAVVDALRARLSEENNFKTAEDRSLARKIVKEIVEISAWIDLTQSLGAFETYDTSRAVARPQLPGTISRYGRVRGSMADKTASGGGTTSSNFEQVLTERITSGFGSKVIKKARDTDNDRSGFPSVHLRWMIERDWSRVLEIDKTNVGTPWSKEDLRLFKKKGGTIAMVVEHECTVAGFVVYELRRDCIRVVKLVVDPNFRRQGIGFSIVEKLYGKLAAPHRRYVEIPVRESNIDGQKFLKASGFRATSIISNGFNRPRENAYVFQAYDDEIRELQKAAPRN